MSIVVVPYTDRQLFDLLRLYEPRRTYWTIVEGAASFLAIPVCWIAASVLAAYLPEAVPRLVDVVLGAVAVGLGSLAISRMWRNKPWRRLAARRLAIYTEHPMLPDGTAWALLPDDAFPEAYRVLARAKLSTGARPGSRPRPRARQRSATAWLSLSPTTSELPATPALASAPGRLSPRRASPPA